MLQSSSQKILYRAIKTIYKYCLKYVQKLSINFEGKVNYIVDHEANFKQQIVSLFVEPLNSEWETV